MLFTSLDFVFFFTTLMAVLGIVRNSRARFWVVLVASYIFYAAWDWRLLSLLLAVSLWNWWLGIRIEDARTPQAARRWVFVGVGLNLAALGYFKYANFFVENFKALFGIESTGALSIVLPLGISFFTFQGISYVVDVHRRVKPAMRDLMMFLFFKAFFPQLIAGPIVRAREFMPQLQRPFRLDRKMMVMGAQYFLVGAVSKLVLADNLAVAADWIWANPGIYDTPTLWLGLLSYSGQIYCDFFGYSMMAIGLARILGYRLPVNFRMPYVSTSIQEFWRRWHITLSNWLRDYLYVALGGNRRGMVRTYANLGLTMLIGGLWHGASWNFVIWGGLHGSAMMVHRMWRRWKDRPFDVGPLLGWFLTFTFATLCYVFFRSPDLTSSVQVLAGLFGMGEGRARWMYTPSLLILGLLVVWHVAYVFSSRWHRGTVGFRRPQRFLPMGAVAAGAAAILLFMPIGGSAPFIYFQF